MPFRAGFFVFVAICNVAGAQVSTPDPKALLVSAQNAAALESEGTPAFHLEASFDTADIFGKPDGTGTLVEDWLDPQNSRIVEHYRDAEVTKVVKDGKTYVAGKGFFGSYIEKELLNALLDAAPTTAYIDKASLLIKYQPLSSQQLTCVVATPLNPDRKLFVDRGSTVFCIAPGSPAIRLVQDRFANTVTLNKLAQLAGHSRPQEIQINRSDRARGSLHVTKFATAPALQASDLKVPPVADLQDLPVHDGPELKIITKALKKVQLTYPPEAKREHVQGTVVLRVIVDTDGSIAHIEVVAGPDSLADSAMHTVKQWVYERPLFDGKPVQVESFIQANFSMGP